MRKPMAVTPGKLEANRCNAQKSTGPKTAKGRAVSKLNALKHGVLAQSVVVRGQQFHESPHEFKKLCQEYYASLAPVGPLEEMLVDQIIQAAWRLRRARLSESGEIALNVDTGWWKRENDNPLPLMLDLAQIAVSVPLFMQLKRSARGCDYLLFCLDKAREGVVREGELTGAILKDFKWGLRDQPDLMVKKLEELRAWLEANPEKLEPDALRARHKKEVIFYLDQQIEYVKWMLDEREEWENAEEQARQMAAVLPSPEVLDKILRYETALERQMFRAMNQLERLQRRRQGENIPAPMTMDISART